MLRVLIVESDYQLGRVWRDYLERLDAQVMLLRTGAEALEKVASHQFDVILLDLVLEDRSALAIADLAHFWQPDTNVIFVTDTPVFADGSIFSHSGNARALLETQTPPEDLTAIVQHYGQISCDRAARRNQLAD